MRKNHKRLNLTIDRKISTGNYEPANCRWVTMKVQERNRLNNDVLTFSGASLCLSEWAERIGLSQAALWNRIYKMRWPLERALTTPARIYR